MHPKRVLVIAVVCLLPSLPAIAAAQEGYDRPGWYLGVGGTYAFHWFPSDFDGDIGATTKTENTPGVNARAGYRFNSWAATELEYEWLDGFENKVVGSRIFELGYHVITANGKLLYPAWGRFQPYGLLGVGVEIIDVSRRAGLGAGLDNNGVGFAGRVGAGLDVYITPHWLVNVGVDAVLSSTQIKNSIGKDLSSLFYIPVQAGVQFRF